MRENKFQAGLIKDIHKKFPDSILLKTDPGYMQGIPDLILLHKDGWAALECKQSAKAHHQPNQDYYVKKMNEMMYASFIYPENKTEVLNAVEQTFRARRTTRYIRS